jgi:excisionase family DNA binding protein
MKAQMTNVEQLDDFLTKEGVAKLLQVSTRTIDNLMAKGALPFLKLGHRTVRFRRQDVARLK